MSPLAGDSSPISAPGTWALPLAAQLADELDDVVHADH